MMVMVPRRWFAITDRQPPHGTLPPRAYGSLGGTTEGSRCLRTEDQVVTGRTGALQEGTRTGSFVYWCGCQIHLVALLKTRCAFFCRCTGDEEAEDGDRRDLSHVQ